MSMELVRRSMESIAAAAAVLGIANGEIDLRAMIATKQWQLIGFADRRIKSEF